jgi:hypothetical protein
VLVAFVVGVEQAAMAEGRRIGFVVVGCTWWREFTSVGAPGASFDHTTISTVNGDKIDQSVLTSCSLGLLRVSEDHTRIASDGQHIGASQQLQTLNVITRTSCSDVFTLQLVNRNNSVFQS